MTITFHSFAIQYFKHAKLNEINTGKSWIVVNLNFARLGPKCDAYAATMSKVQYLLTGTFNLTPCQLRQPG